MSTKYVVTIFKGSEGAKYTLSHYDFMTQFVAAAKSDPEVTSVENTVVWERDKDDELTNYEPNRNFDFSSPNLT